MVIGIGRVNPGSRVSKSIWYSATGILMAFFALASWAVASPVGSSPDDNFHLTSIWCGVGDRDGLCESSDGLVRVPSALLVSSDCLKNPRVAANCNSTIDGEGTSETAMANNVTGSYPRFFYAVSGIFASQHISASVVAIRVFNAVLLIGLLAAIVLLAPITIRRAAFFACVFTVVPLGMFIIPSTNPSSWAVISALTLVPFTLIFLTAQKKHALIASGIFSMLAVLIGAGSRVDSALYCVIALAGAWIVSLRFEKLNWKRAIFVATLISLSLLMYRLGGSAANLVASAQQDWLSNPILLFNTLNLPSLWQGSFGSWGLGWFDIDMPAVVPVFAWGAFFAAIVLGLRYMWRLKSFVIAGLSFAAFLIPFYVVMHDSVFVGNYVQPRYVYPLLIVIALIAATTPDAGDQLMARTQALVMASLVSVSNSAALFTVLKRYAQGTDNYSFWLNADIGWWWVQPQSVPFAFASPMMIWFFGTASFAIAAVFAAMSVSSSEPKQSSFYAGSL